MARWSENFTKNYINNHRNDSQYDWYNTLAYAMNEESAAKQMQFQDYMSSTAHTREVRDLMNAGLNPILAANNGAATGSGAYAGVDTSAIAMKQNFRLQNILQQRQLRQDKALTERGQNMNQELGYANLFNQAAMNRYSVDMGYKLGIDQASISAGAVTAAAAMNAAATKYASDNSRAAQQYASDNALQAANYSADKSLEGTIYSQNAQSSRQADKLAWDTRYPTSFAGLGSSLLRSLDNLFGYNPTP